jgi:hypothetical protein
MKRDLEEDGVNFAFQTWPEIRDRMRSESRRQANRRGTGGVELRSQAYVMNALTCYFLSTTDAERARIVDLGRAIFDRRASMDERDPWEQLPPTTAVAGPEQDPPPSVEADPPAPGAGPIPGVIAGSLEIAPGPIQANADGDHKAPPKKKRRPKRRK